MTAMAMTHEDYDAPDIAQLSRLSRFLIGAAALLAAGFAVWGFFRLTGMQPVARLQVEGRLQRVDASEVDRAVRPLLDATFVEVDLQSVQGVVTELPWVARARAEREWPATVRVRLWEREPAARWGADSLLDMQAIKFAPEGRSLPDTLPQLSGPEGSASRVLATYRQLSTRLDGTPFALKGLNQDARGDWTATTIDGVELRFGRSDPLLALDMLLGPGARALAGHLAEVAHIDLRYTNGFSVGWREQPPTDKKKRN